MFFFKPLNIIHWNCLHCVCWSWSVPLHSWHVCLFIRVLASRCWWSYSSIFCSYQCLWSDLLPSFSALSDIFFLGSPPPLVFLFSWEWTVNVSFPDSWVTSPKKCDCVFLRGFCFQWSVLATVSWNLPSVPSLFYTCLNITPFICSNCVCWLCSIPVYIYAHQLYF